MKRNLTKNEIIRYRADISNIFANANLSYSFKNLRVKAIKNNLEYSRILVCPVRKYGNAIQRNRIRRVMKEIFRLNKFRILDGYDIAFIVYKGNDEYQTREEQFNMVLKNISLFKDNS